MKFEERLKEKIGSDAGFRVPEGYFEEAFTRILAELPERETSAPQPVTRWQKVRPYIYMAAMFAGIWLMMKAFHTASTADMSLHSEPRELAALVADPRSYDYFEMADANVNDGVSDYRMEQDVLASYEDFDDFRKDFEHTYR